MGGLQWVCCVITWSVCVRVCLVLCCVGAFIAGYMLALSRDVGPLLMNTRVAFYKVLIY